MSCRVCLTDSTEKLEIFKTEGPYKNIAEIIEKHLWFTPLPDDALSNVICIECWTRIDDFNDFYEKAKRIHEQKQELDIIFETDSSNFAKNASNDDFYVTVLVDEIDYLENEIDASVFETEINGFQLENLNETIKNRDIIKANEIGKNDVETVIELSNENGTATCGKKKRKRTSNSRSTAEDDKIVRKHISLHCEICNYKADIFTDIIMHFASNHATQQAYINCCGRRFTKRERIVQHAWLHEDPKHFQCPICKRVFRDNDIKNAHMKAQHPTEDELIYSCDQCEKRFARVYLLKLHKAVHVPVDKRQFFCHKCGPPKAFASQNQLNIHNSMSHNRPANFVCEVCGKTIRDRQAFKKHVRLHFEESGPRVKCPEPGCESWLKDEDNLKQHLRRHKSNNESLQCDQCDKLYKNRRALTTHKRFVHPTQLLSCEVCSKLFKKSISLKEHMATHTGESLYECPFCTQKFKSNANMHAHKKKAHFSEWQICKNLKNH